MYSSTYSPTADSGTENRSNRTPIAIRTDNLIRQKLRIGDPRDPRQIADGLKQLFPADARTFALEEAGLPILPVAVGVGPVRAVESQATSAELRQAIDNVERDLQALTTDHRLKDITAELQGWGHAIRTIISDGAAAARLTLDPGARDRLFGARRVLGDYARLARLIGALTQTLNQSYRRLAQSLDEVASLLLVLAGEALAASGMAGGRFLLSVPASELQSRRDAILMALRALLGSSQQAYGNDQWPWGLSGLRETLRIIERSGHLDLRALLDENVLGGLLDELIERASQHSATSLRALGATSEVAVQRLFRLLFVVDDNVKPPSPPVATFLEAIQLFLDAFTSSKSGYRLLFVARAPISFYGLSGIGGPDDATRRLIALVIERGKLAELLDCYLGCKCCESDMICQILLDKLLYDTDRAIDLYTLGSKPAGDGEPEFRAAAFGLLVLIFLEQHAGGECLSAGCFARVEELIETLNTIRKRLNENKLTLDPAGGIPAGTIILPDPDNKLRTLITEELCLQRLADKRLDSLIATLAPACVLGSRVLGKIDALIEAATIRIDPNHVAEGRVCAEVQNFLPQDPASSFQAQSNSLRALSKIVGEDGNCVKLCPDSRGDLGYPPESYLKAEDKPAKADRVRRAENWQWYLKAEDKPAKADEPGKGAEPSRQNRENSNAPDAS